MSTSFAGNEGVIRLGGLALALGAVGLPFGAHASVVSYTIPQSLPASINFDPTTGAVGAGAPTQFIVSVPTGTLHDQFETAVNNGTVTGVTALAAGGDATKFGSSATIGPSSFTYNSGSAPMDTSLVVFTGDSPYYIGLRVQVPAPSTPNQLSDTTPSYDYGYAFYDTISATPVLSYAFQTVADTAITTPAAVPEPASLALLAMGAAGVAALRRGRKAA